MIIQSYVNEMTEVLQACGFTESEILTGLAYIEGNILKDELIVSVAPKDFKLLQREQRRKTWALLSTLRKKKVDSERIGRYLSLFIHIGKDSFLETSADFNMEDALWRRGCLRLVTQYEVPYTIVWEWMLAKSKFVDYRGNPESYALEFVELLAQSEPDLLHKLYPDQDVAVQPYIAALLTKHNGEDYEALAWFENHFHQLASADLLDTDKRSQLRNCVYLAVTVKNHSRVAFEYLKKLINEDPNAFVTNCRMAFYHNRDKELRKIPGMLEEFGALREHYLINLAEPGLGSRDGSYDDVLREEFADRPESFRKAIEMSHGLKTIHLCRIVWEKDEEKPYLSEALREFASYLESLIPNDPQLHAYFRGEIPFSDVERYLRHLHETSTGSNYRRLLDLKDLRNLSEMFDRGLCFLAYADMETLWIMGSWMSDKGFTVTELADRMTNAGGDSSILLPMIVTKSYAQHSSGDEAYNQTGYQYLKSYIRVQGEVIVALLQDSEDNKYTKKFLLEELYQSNNEKYIPLISTYLKDDNKVVRDTSITLLREYPAALPFVKPYLIHKKPAIRESAVQLLSSWNDEPSHVELELLLHSEKNEKIKMLILNILKEKPEITHQEPISQDDIASYCMSKLIHAKLQQLDWIPFDELPLIRLKANQQVIEPVISQYLFYTYAIQNEIVMNWEARSVAEHLEPEDLSQVAWSLLQHWLESGAEVQKKWIMAFATMFGDERSINQLHSCILKWPLESRIALAADTVKALVLSKKNSGLLIVDQLARKSKFKQLKKTALEALAKAAKELDIDPEELADRIISNLGFNSTGQQVFQFGDSELKLILTNKLEIRIEDAGGNTYKSLPTPRKHEDGKQIKSAMDDFKQLKKELKLVKDSITIRLEQAMSTRRYWTKQAWESLFKENAILHFFARSLIWGTYTEGKELQNTFLYLDDGSYISADHCVVVLEENSYIRLSHPLELKQASLELWREQLEKLEITQPVAQLDRKVFRPEQGESLRIEHFGGVQVNGFSLLGKLTKAGWQRGSIVDGGGYDEFFKENEHLGVGVNLTFSGTSAGYEDETVTVYDLVFYIAGKVKRGPYIYSNIQEEELIRPSDIPNYFYSEILYDVDQALSARVGFVEDWK
ncbi:DUF4132 domain-containing protein [Paenibacillus sp. LMG 31461]|uniref:DUF4132 domain-containing protein n=1 Tax=Paenibacillus plantarum TaxID=2654975 RepID=A0ABX1XA32_9BACL|nr:DUF4132 domain-containing protein [Paenibacillus plantarum]NOU64805.1 DUF4132 domain-containing protein [Paenibacillus plantarum]